MLAGWLARGKWIKAGWTRIQGGQDEAKLNYKQLDFYSNEEQV